MDSAATYAYLSELWTKGEVLKTLEDYIRIPNQSPLFDVEWATNGYMDKAMDLLHSWVKAQNVPGLTSEVIKLEGRTPLMICEVEGTNGKKDDCVLLYGHMDKQPPLADDWSEGLGPYLPVYRDGKLYGRGGADDGYAIFAAVGSIQAMKKQNVSHSRCVILIEASEESGSPDLPAYVAHLKDRIGTPSLIVCLDSGCGNYNQWWLTTSLRGIIVGTLRVDIITEGVHSGASSGVIPSSFRIIRQLLARIEDETTGKVLVEALDNGIPDNHLEKAKEAAGALGKLVYSEFPFVEGAQPMGQDPVELLLNKTWRATVSYTGVEGIPALANAGNVLRPFTSIKLSVRAPPNVDPQVAGQKLKEVLEANPPYGAKVTFTFEKSGPGWIAPDMQPWLSEVVEEASKTFYEGRKACYIGEGGSIPFMGMLNKQFPEAQFVITGVLGPRSNAHGPNEFLEIEMSKKVTCCVAHVLAKHSQL
eukprot:CAMPEP_0177651934 /NCGR_PEP_ID=MMETSP0447-20121125/12831_1 /TAXON_ID=0 /ORGANISM="Stygamoeba regulata, Strain BSH-02190019" /LENGTH=474 /DNA_ID=CAMNT_0019155085 /DNA_START=16 /DNA_END=1440 /DNA_ORIENTATION=+